MCVFFLVAFGIKCLFLCFIAVTGSARRGKYNRVGYFGRIVLKVARMEHEGF